MSGVADVTIEPQTQATTRERIFATLLGVFVVCLMCWPLAQGFLVQKYGLNPWKGFAIAMYCTRHAVTVEVLAATPKGLIASPSEDLKTREIFGLYQKYNEQRQTLGLLAGPPPAELATAIMKRYPGLKDVLFRIRNYRLDPASGRMAIDMKCVYHFRMSGGQAVLFDQDERAELLGKNID